MTPDWNQIGRTRSLLDITKILRFQKDRLIAVFETAVTKGIYTIYGVVTKKTSAISDRAFDVWQLNIDIPLKLPPHLLCGSGWNISSGGLIYEYLSTLCPPNHDVMQHTRRVKAGLSRHWVYFPFFLCQLIFLPAPFFYILSLFS